MEQLHIALAFDSQYINPFYALSNSIRVNHQPGSIHLHLIVPDLSPVQKNEIKNYIEQFARVSFYEIDKELVSGFVLSGKWTASVYYRIFFPLLMPPSVQRFLYIDCDTLVTKNLTEFFNVDLKLFPVAAVYDNYVKSQPLIGIVEEGEYFNSGVLLIDVVRWKEFRISEKAIDYLLKHPQNIRFVDQCALNAVLKNNWLKLSCYHNLLYTYLPEGGSMSSINHYAIKSFVVHFTLERPWRMLCKNRLRKLYRDHLTNAGKKFRYTDFSWRNSVAFMKIRLVELYFDLPLLQRTWRLLKPATV